MYIPDDTIAFMDNLIITKDAANYDLAMKFIDFMTSNNVEKKAEDGEESQILEPSFANTYYVDYDAVFNSVYDELVDLSSTEFETDEGLYDLIYDASCCCDSPMPCRAEPGRCSDRRPGCAPCNCRLCVVN